MNVRQKARRSDALHYDYISRRDLCNMIANLESDLEDEKADNAKLRELVETMPYCMTARCLECPLHSKYDPSIGGVPFCKAVVKLRELGMEVE